MIMLPKDTKVVWTGDKTGKEQWKVRQPLWATVIGDPVEKAYEEIIKDELNVKHLFVCKDIGDKQIIMPNSTTGWCGEWVAFVRDGKQLDLNKFVGGLC